MARRIWDEEQDVRQAVRDEAAELLADPYPEDRVFEIVDGSVPIYTAELMELAAEDTRLATDEPELGPAFDGSPTPVNIIAANVFERLHEAAMAELQQIRDEAEEAEDATV